MPPKPEEGCERCRLRSNPEYYVLMFIEWDVEKARRIVSDGRKPVRLTIENACNLSRVNAIHQEHINHVPLGLPGILAPIPPGKVYGFALIDGNHRALGRRQGGETFMEVYKLTDRESASCITSKDRVKALAKGAKKI